ncbi:MAG: PfkB family carbohydrate kinase [Pirellulales bacterium]
MTTSENSSQKALPLIFGEVLFDCFPDSQVLGGAPFNVAWNLQGLGLSPAVITAVGDDELGRIVIDRAASWNIDRSGIQVSSFPTGRVDISTENGEPTYTFWDNVAFDQIVADEKYFNNRSPSLLYHGSLALRGNESRETLFKLRSDLKVCPIFVDINLRLPHYDFALTESILKGVSHLKLNHEELDLLHQFLFQTCSDDEIERGSEAANQALLWEHRQRTAHELQQRFGIQHIWLTAAEQGAAWLGPEGAFEVVQAPRVGNLVDTVGAGDALTAVIIHGLSQCRSPIAILRDAVQFAAKVCQIRGATSADASFYQL